MEQIHAAGSASHAHHEAGTCVHMRRRAAVLRHAALTTSKLAAIGIAIALTLSASPPALARGGFGHIGHHGELGHMGQLGGVGHIGHGSGIEGGRAAIVTPAYVLISTTALSDKNGFADALHGLADAVLPFEGRVISDVDTPSSWEGTAAAHVTMIEFDSANAAQRWKNSDAYKNFDAQLRKASTSSIQQLPGVPTARPAAMANARMHGRGLDPQAFEPMVKQYDATLKKMHGICNGC
jgi:uncharacterized protein (DUF1330 family)